MKKVPEDNLEGKIKCDIHGNCSSVEFNYNNETLKKVCFRCYMEKVTYGLKNYKLKVN